MSLKNLPHWFRIILFYAYFIFFGIGFSILCQQEEVVATYNTTCNWIFEHVLHSDKRYYTTKQLQELTSNSAASRASLQTKDFAEHITAAMCNDQSAENARIVAEALAPANPGRLLFAAMRESLIAEGEISRDMSAQDERYDALVEYNYRIRMGTTSNDQSQDFAPSDVDQDATAPQPLELELDDIDPEIYNEKTINKYR